MCSYINAYTAWNKTIDLVTLQRKEQIAKSSNNFAQKKRRAYTAGKVHIYHTFVRFIMVRLRSTFGHLSGTEEFELLYNMIALVSIKQSLKNMGEWVTWIHKKWPKHSKTTQNKYILNGIYCTSNC